MISSTPTTTHFSGFGTFVKSHPWHCKQKMFWSMEHISFSNIKSLIGTFISCWQNINNLKPGLNSLGVPPLNFLELSFPCNLSTCSLSQHITPAGVVPFRWSISQPALPPTVKCFKAIVSHPDTTARFHIAQQYKTDYQLKCIHFVWKFDW